MNFKPEDLLFSDSSFQMPFALDNDTPSYNPQVGTVYVPRLEKEKLEKVIFSHEYFHQHYSKRPSICFQKLISRFIYYEFTRDKFSSSSTISTLFPSKNPPIKMLGDILAEIHSSNVFVHEALVLQRQYKNPRKLINAGIDPEDWLERAIRKTDIDLPSFKRTCRAFCKSEFMNSIRTTIGHFSLAPPFFFPEVPVDRKGALDSSKINSEIADRVVEKFRSKYHSLPYSPWKRFSRLVSSANQIENSKHQPSLGYFLQRVRDDEKLNVDLEARKAPYNHDVCLNEKRFCPIDTLYSEGLKVPFVDYGRPRRNFGDENFGKMFQCRVRTKPLSDDENIKKKEEIQKRQNINEMSRVYEQIQSIKQQGKSLILFTGSGLRHKGFQLNWPFSAFLLGSEILRYIVFSKRPSANRSKCVKLIDYFYDSAVESNSNDLKPSNPIPVEDSIDFPELKSSKHLSPFLTAEARVKNLDGTLVLINWSRGGNKTYGLSISEK